MSLAFRAGVQNQVSKTFSWGVAAEYAYGSTLDVDKQSTAAVTAAAGAISLARTRTQAFSSSPPISPGSSDGWAFSRIGSLCGDGIANSTLWRRPRAANPSTR